MANDRNTGDLLIKIGLDLEAVDRGLVYLNRKLPENIKALEEKLKQEQSKLNIEAQGAKNQDEYLDARYHRLQQILKVQQQLANLYAAENKSSGDPKALTAKLKMDEQIAARKKELEETVNILKMLKQLDAAEKSHKAKSLAEAMKEGRAAYRDNSRYGREANFKDNASAKIEKITTAFNELKAASGSVSGVIDKTIEIFGKIPSTFGVAGKAVAAVALAFVGIPLAAKKVQDTLLELADPAMKAGDALYAAAKGAQMTLSEFAEFSRVCKVTGIDISEVTTMAKKMQTALIKVESGISGTGGANAKFLVNTLKAYGVEIRKSNGELKNAYDLSISLSEGLKRAQEQGRGRDFVTAIGASGDFATYLEDLAGNIELEKKVVKNRLADPALAHNAQGELNALNLQAEQLKGAFSAAFLPVANEMIPKIREQLGSLTSVIADNAEGIRAVASSVGEVALKVSDLTTKIIELGAGAIGTIGEVYSGKATQDRLLKEYKEIQEIKNARDLMEAELQKELPTTRAAILNNPAIYNAKLYEYEKRFREIEDARNRTENFYIDALKKLTPQKLREHRDESQSMTPAEQEAHLQRMAKLAEEISKLKLDLQFGDDNYGKSLAELEQWKEKSLEAIEPLKKHRKEYEEEVTAISERENLKREEIERNHQKKLQEIRQSINAHFQTDLQNKFDSVDANKNSWTAAGMDESEAEISALKLKNQAKENLEKEFAVSISSIHQSELDKRLAEIERERQAWIQKGIDEVRATELSEQQKAKAIEDAENSITEKENQLADKQDQLNNLYKERNNIYEEFKEHAQKVAAQVQSIWDTELNNRLKQIEQERQAFIKQGVDEAAAAKWAAQAKIDAERNAAMQILKSQLQAYRAFKSGGYEALKRYELNQLYKQGITPDDLKMTPEQLQKFSFAQKAVQNSLMPNFMTDTDSKRVTAAKAGASNMELPDVTVSMTDEWEEKLQNNSEQIAKATAELADLRAEISEAVAALQNASATSQDSAEQYFDMQVDGKPVDTKLIEEYFGKPQFEPLPSQQVLPSDFNSIFDGQRQALENAGGYFGELAQQVTGTTAAFSNLIDKINSLDFSQGNTPPNVTNNVSIQAAHAWDYSHIQELAERVADVITPKILSALGGNSIGY